MPFIIRAERAARQRDLFMRHRDVGNTVEQMVDAIEPRSLLVVGLDDESRRFGNVGASEHVLLGLGVFLPADARLQVHRAELPPLERIVNAHKKSHLLLFVSDGEPVLSENDA